jgi:Na+/melibiose symporter-like transporter
VLIYGAWVFLIMMATFLGTGGARATEVDETSQRVPLREQLGAVLANRPFMMMVGIKVLQFVALWPLVRPRRFSW